MHQFRKPVYRTPEERREMNLSLLNLGEKQIVPLDYKEHRRLFWRSFYRTKEKKGFVVIQLTDNDISYAEAFAKKVIRLKQKESHHENDGQFEFNRWVVGTLGEVALGKFLGVKIHDNKVGNSENFDVPDLQDALGLRCGVKAFRVDNFPLTNRILYESGRVKRSAYPQVFIGICTKKKVAYLYGVATVDDLAENERMEENEQFIKDRNASKRKVAFTQLETISCFHDVASLESLISGQKGSQKSS
ncbi:hypothetical protein [Rossellomorea marisflavi]|uniref:hypothetical protein n=1 Tax=Rossellomorea marisflavi TaxID=189381 RepID=UPI003F9F7F33